MRIILAIFFLGYFTAHAADFNAPLVPKVRVVKKKPIITIGVTAIPCDKKERPCR